MVLCQTMLNHEYFFQIMMSSQSPFMPLLILSASKTLFAPDSCFEDQLLSPEYTELKMESYGVY